MKNPEIACVVSSSGGFISAATAGGGGMMVVVESARGRTLNGVEEIYTRKRVDKPKVATGITY